MTDAAVHVTLMRHGETTGPLHVLRGKHDTPLAAAGWRQMRQAADAANTPPFSAIAASPLARCRAFAEKFAAEGQLPLTLYAGLEELDFGDWEELTPLEARSATPELFARFQIDPESLAPPRGESFTAFRQRVHAAFHACLAQHPQGHVLIVTHAGVMRVMLSEILGLSWEAAQRIALPPAATCQLSFLQGHAPYLLNLNGGQTCAT